MPFFPQSYLSPEPTLFHLLSALDAQTPQKSAGCGPAGCGPRRHTPQTFTPRFDVTETLDAYELYGEVPGLENDGLTIEFSDAQTLVIKGKTERRQQSQQSQEPAAETTATETAPETASETSHNATVEDDYDEADTPLATPASTSTLTAEEKGKQPEGQASSSSANAEENVVKPKYWVAERRVGEFARSFTFEQRIEQDFVTAGLKNGILHVVVPKNLRRGKVVVSVN